MRLLALATAAGLIAAAAVATAAPAAATGSTYTWVGNSQTAAADNHSWTDPNNWSPSGVPGDGDSVWISEPDPNHCTARVDNVPTVALVNFTLASTRCSSSITGGRITVTGLFSWNGGTLSTPTTLAASATGTLSGTNGHLNVLSTELDVAGTLTLSGVVDSGASNQGGFRIVNPNVLHVLPGGTLASQGTNAVQYLSCCVNPARIVNDGTLAVGAGDLVVRAVAIDQNGTLTASGGGRLRSVGGPNTAGPGAAYSGAGGWRIENGASLKPAGTQTVGSGFHLELGGLDVDAGARLGGTATLTGAGEFDWTGGTVEGNLTIAHGMTVRASGAHAGNGKRVLSGVDGLSGSAAATITNHGTITVDQDASVLTAYQAKLVNAADGTLTLAPGTQLTTLSCCVNPNRVVNSGRLVVPAGSSSAPVVFSGVAYQAQGGTTSIAAGRSLELDEAPGTLSGAPTAATVSGGGSLTVAAPTAVAGTIAVGTGTHLVLQTRGSLDGTATVSGNGALTWRGGSISGNVVLAPAGGVSVTGTDLKTLANVGGGATTSKLTIKARTAIGAGTSAKHDRLDLGRSVLTLTGATTVANNVDLANGTVVNTGSLTVNPGSTGAVTASTTLVNRGTLTVRSGRLAATGSYSQTAGTTSLAAHTRLDLIYTTRSIALAGGVLAGTGTIGGGVTNTGATVQPGGSAVGTLAIKGAYSQGGRGRLALDLAATSRDALVVSGTVSLQGTVAAHNVGRYNPPLGAKYRVLSGSRVGYGRVTVTSSGTGTSTRHWVGSHTTTGVYLTWRRK